MQILHLSAKNFRCFVDFQVELHSGFNLLIGGNGAGKTAVLDALKIGLGGFFQGFPGGKTYGFASTDMRLDPGPDQDGIPDMQPQAPTVLSWSGRQGPEDQVASQASRAKAKDDQRQGRTSSANGQRSWPEKRCVSMPVRRSAGVCVFWNRATVAAKAARTQARPQAPRLATWVTSTA